jgi:hypothetical protein
MGVVDKGPMVILDQDGYIAKTVEAAGFIASNKVVLSEKLNKADKHPPKDEQREDG